MMSPTENAARQAGTGQAGMAETGSLQFITFTLGEEDYGVDIMVVREIKGWTETTAIPNAPRFIHGVINLRGIIVPIMDLRARFGMALTVPSRMHVVIIINTGARTIGLLVDAVSDIISVTPGCDPRGAGDGVGQRARKPADRPGGTGRPDGVAGVAGRADRHGSAAARPC